MKPLAISPALLALVIAGCGAEEQKIAQSNAALTAICVDEETPPPADGWRCDESIEVECDTLAGAEVDYIYVDLDDPADPDAAPSCEDTELAVSDEGPYPPGDYLIAVTRVDGDDALLVCESALTVVDTTPPAIEPRVVELWPPNHKLHEITPHDCLDIHDACDADVEAWFTWASSDEPVDANGDGNSEPDIVALGCGAVSLRSERQGGGDGRVYTLGWMAADHAGNTVEGTCQVVVPHDQSGREAVDSGEDHRVEHDEICHVDEGADDDAGEGPDTPPTP